MATFGALLFCPEFALAPLKRIFPSTLIQKRTDSFIHYDRPCRSPIATIRAMRMTLFVARCSRDLFPSGFHCLTVPKLLIPRTLRKSGITQVLPSDWPRECNNIPDKLRKPWGLKCEIKDFP
jgi:hypothetical protein